jgi:hypothetical protein
MVPNARSECVGKYVTLFGPDIAIVFTLAAFGLIAFWISIGRPAGDG